MPREHDSEWMLRARVWAAAWKSVALVLVGVLVASFCYLRFGYVEGGFWLGGLILFGGALVLWFRA